MPRTSLALLAIFTLGPLAAPLPAHSEEIPSVVVADLADIASGLYLGDVISDARGSSRSNVIISVDKIGPDEVRITSDYERLPEFTVGLMEMMSTIQQVGTEELFLLDLSKSPHTLMITVDDASWGGTKQ